MEMLNVKVNGIAVSVPKGATILEAARKAGVEIPTLCYLKEINEIGACRICVVEVERARSLVAACVMPVSEGIILDDNKIKIAENKIRKHILNTDDIKTYASENATKTPSLLFRPSP